MRVRGARQGREATRVQLGKAHAAFAFASIQLRGAHLEFRRGTSSKWQAPSVPASRRRAHLASRRRACTSLWPT